MAPLLYIMDGSGYIFRAFFALPRLSTRAGQPTNALYGFTTMMLKLLRQQPEGLVVAFESTGPTFRRELSPAYKAHRPEVSDDLRSQIPHCMAMVRALGIRTLAVQGFEADDVIATLCDRALEWGMEPVILSSDKDLMQLVGERIRMIDPINDRPIGPEQVREKLGVGPEKVVDLLALAGDATDNVPGVAGIGIKTAAKLLEEFGDLDTLMARAGEVKGKRGETLRASAADVELSRRLVTLRRDVPLEIEPADLRPGTPDWPSLRALLQRFEFSGLLRNLPPEAGEEGEGDGERGGVALVGARLAGSRFSTLRSASEVGEALAACRDAGRMAIAAHSISLAPGVPELVGVALAWRSGEAVYVPLAHRGEQAGLQPQRDEVLALLRPLLEDPALPKVGQNLKATHRAFSRHGIDLRGIAGDPMIASYLLHPDAAGNHDLRSLAEQHLQHRTIAFADVVAGDDAADAFCRVPVARATEFAGEQVLAALELADLLGKQVEEAQMGRLYREVELPLCRVLAKIEARGIALDPEGLRTMSGRFEERLAELERECHLLAKHPFLVSSPRQLAEVLFDELGLPQTKKTKTARSTDQSVLEELALHHPLPAKVLEYRQVAKLKNTYLDTLPRMLDPETRRLHTSLNQAVAATGRLSSAEPNLQNIPIRTEDGRRIRAAFVGGAGHLLLSADYSQIELRVLAHLAEERLLIEAFRRGEDIHQATAAELFGTLPLLVTSEQRRAAKTINFGILYGMSAFRLAREQGMSRAMAQQFIDRYFDRYPRIRGWIAENLDRARESGMTVTLLGRRRPIPGLKDRNHVTRSAAERVATNTPIQGSAADIIKLAMVKLQSLEDQGALPARMVLQVHDELLLEVPEGAADESSRTVREAMAGAVELLVPLVVEVGLGRSWAEAH